MTIAHSLFSLQGAVHFYASQYALDIDGFCGKALMEDHQITFIAPRSLTGTEAFLVADLSPTNRLKPVVDAVCNAANNLRWLQSYSLNDPGFDQNYLDNYAWFNLIAPSGPFISDSM